VLERIEDMAGVYLKALCAAQPTDPYCLGGWSMGGVVAFEMACQLKARGRRVKRLILIDTDNPAGHSDPSPRDDVEMLRLFRGSLGLQTDRLCSARFDVATGLEYCARDAVDSGIIDEASQIRPLWRVFAANVRAMWAYVPGSFSDPISVITAEEPPREDPTLGWRPYVRSVFSRTAPGNHFTMMNGRNAGALAAVLSQVLDGHKCSQAVHSPARFLKVNALQKPFQ
jgi:thioesterase domain-containing protein